jgi:hypothetical protein
MAGVVGLPASARAQSAGQPKSVRRPEQLLPSSFNVERVIQGDLDKDGDTDVVVLGTDVDDPSAEEIDPSAGEGERILIVGRRDRNGLTAVGSSRRAVLCRSCGGAFWGGRVAPVELAISRGSLVITQEAGARELTQWIHRYRIEKGVVRLIGFDQTVADRATGGSYSISINYLTGKQVTTVTGEIDNAPRAGTSAGKPRTIKLEAVTLEQNP